MLHVAVNTHSEESCAFRGEPNRGALVGGFEKLQAIAGDHGATIHHIWTNMASHTVFFVIEAPDSHVVDRLFRDAGLVGRTTTRVYAVENFETAVAAVNKAS